MNDTDRAAEMSTRLHEWGARLDALMAEVDDAAARDRLVDLQPLANLHEDLRVARSRIAELVAESDDRAVTEAESDDRAVTEIGRAQPAPALEAKLERLREEELEEELERELDANVTQIEAQLANWSRQLDHLVANAIKAGSQSNDAYRVRIDHLRAHLDAVQVKLAERKRPTGNSVPPWDNFKASIDNDWAALEDGFQDLAH